MVELQARLARGLQAPAFHMRPLLIAGPPGGGKTWLARRIAALLSEAVLVYPCAGVNSAVALTGTGRSFTHAHPGLIVEAMARHATAAPVVIWDEIDRAGSSDWNGRFHDALLQRLEPETSRTLWDDYLQVTVDHSHVLHLATANDIGALPPALLSRFDVADMPEVTSSALDMLIAAFRNGLAAELMIPPERVPELDGLATERLHRQLRRSPDLRRLKAAYRQEITAAIRIPHCVGV